MQNPTVRGAIQRAGGFEKYKKNVAELLQSDDPVVTGYSCIWLADLDAKEYLEDIRKIAVPKKLAVPANQLEDSFSQFGVSCAATAIGVLGTNEDIQLLLKLLEQDDRFIRSGAADGLGWICVKIVFHN